MTPEEKREYSRRYYAEHKEQLKANHQYKMQRFGEEMLARQREANRKYYASHKELCKERVKRYQARKRAERNG